jgi:hypothetical protein
MRYLILAIVVAAATLLSSASRADDRDFIIVNSTGYPIKFIGVNPPGDNEWTENELGGVLKDGDNIKVRFNQTHKGCAWNVKVTWADDNTSSIFRGLDLCKIEVMTLRYDKASDKASYTTR